jgi:cytochrome c oxidase subunit 2
MPETKDQLRSVLIVSANPLFREGLRKVYAERWSGKAKITGMPTTMDETIAMLERQQPDLVIVDHDDRTINRDEFLNRFFAGETPMQVVLVSLGESGQVVVYDRRRLTSAQAENWLNDLWNE